MMIFQRDPSACPAIGQPQKIRQRNRFRRRGIKDQRRHGALKTGG